MKRTTLITCSLFLMTFAFMAKADILTETPYYWYMYDRGILSFAGQTALGMVSAKSGNTNAESPWGHALGTTGEGPYGTGFSLPDGDWTYHIRAKMPANVRKGVVWSLGNWTGSENALLLLTRANDAGLTLAVGKSKKLSATQDIDIPGLSSDYHDITVVYTKASQNVDLYVDAVLIGTLNSYTAPTGGKGWQWFSAYGGSHSSASMNHCVGALFEEFRFYQRALTTDEMAALRDGACSGTITLEEDTDWSEGVPAGKAHAIIDMNGHALTLPNISVAEVYRVTNGAGGEAAVLTFDIASGTSATTHFGQVSGNITLRKAGAGTATTYGSGSYDKVTMDCVIDEGTLKLGYVSIGDGQTVTIGEKGTLDENGCGDTKFKTVMKNGATLANTGSGLAYNAAQLTGGITLAEGATAYVDNTNEMSFTATKYAKYPLALNGGTLVKRGTAVLNFTNAQVTNGTVRVEAGKLYLNAGNKGFSASADTVFEATDDGTFYTANAAAIPTLRGNGAVSGAATLTVTNVLGGEIAVNGAVTLANGGTLDLSMLNAAYAKSANLAFGEGMITLDVHNRGLTNGEQIVSWSAIPANVTFQWDATTLAGEHEDLKVTSSGIYYGEIIATAHWTGVADDGDPTNPVNWACTNSLGVVSTDVVPTTDTAVKISGETALTTTSDRTFQAKSIDLVGDVTLTNDCDWTYFPDVAITGNNRMIDVNGHNLTLAKVFTGTVTDGTEAVPSGSLTLTVAENATITNATLAMTGNLKFIKGGAGTLVMAKNAEISEAEIASGLFKLYKCRGLLGAGTVTIDAGATLDSNGCYDTAYGLVLQNGATLMNSGTGRGYTKIQFGGGIALAEGAMAYVDNTNEMSFTATKCATYPIDLNGGTLVKRGTAVLDFTNAQVTNGTVRVEAGNLYLNAGNKGFLASADTVFEATDDGTFYTANAATIPTLRGNGAVSGAAMLTVTNVLGGEIAVNGAVTLANGGTLDLSMLNAAYVKSDKLAFGAGTITVDIHGRELKKGEQVVAWTAIPANVAFMWDDATLAGEPEPLTVTEEGIFHGVATVDTAHWTNALGDGDVSNPANWACTNSADKAVVSVPTADSTVYIAGDAINAQITNAVNWGTVNVRGKLGADCDWTGLGTTTIAEGSAIDVNGHNLTLAKVFTGTVTDGTEAVPPGSLTLTVAENATITNETLVLSGNMKLIKEGAGTFVGRRQDQNYTGGTVVNAGTVKSIGYENKFYYGADATPFTINAGGALDINGQYSWYRHHIYLNGGEIRNSGGNQTTYTYKGLGDVTLTADSTAYIGAHTLFHCAGATLDLGGCTLTVTGGNKYFSFSYESDAYTITNGTLVISTGAQLNTRTAAVNLTDTRLVIEADGKWLHKNAEFTVRDLTMENDTGSDKKVLVTDAFKSVSSAFKYVCLKDGATLDLTENAGALEATDKNLAFEANATITVDVSGWTLKKGTQVVAWDAIPANVTFVWDDATLAGEPEPLTVTEEGIFHGVATVDTAHWTNALGDGDVSNPANWACTNSADKAVVSVPTADSTVYFAGDAINAQITNAVNWGTVNVRGKLGADCDWTGLVTTPIAEGSAINVNGHNLTLGSFKLGGNLGLSGAGTVTVAKGATLDSNGCYDTAYGLVLQNGATLMNSGTGRGYTKIQFGGGITLAENATAYVDNTSEISATAPGYDTYPINLNGGTIVKRGTGKWGIVNANITGGGKIVVEQGEFNIGNKGFACNPEFVLEARKDSSAYVWVETAMSVPTILGDGYVASNGKALSVTNRLSGLITLGKADGKYPFTATQKLTLAGGATLDLTNNTEPYVPHANFAFGAGTITVDVSGHTLMKGDKLIAWTAIPADVTFQWDDATAQAGVAPVVGDSGLFYGAEIATATWNGGASGDVTDPKNWVCRDPQGTVVADALPGRTTSVAMTVAKMPTSVPAGKDAICGVISITGKLDRDIDWSGYRYVTFASGSSLDLNGHTFKIGHLGDFDGAMAFIDSATTKGRLDVAAGTVKLRDDFTIDKGITLRLGGAATLDENGTIDTAFKLLMADGATLTNTGSEQGFKRAQITGGITLEAKATAYVSPKNEISSTMTGYGTYPIDLNGGTIVKRGTGKWGLVNVEIAGGGTIVVEQGELNIGRVGLACEADFVLETRKESSAYVWVETARSVTAIMGDGYVASDGQTLWVTRRFSGLVSLGKANGTYPFTATQKLTLAGGATLDLTDNTEPYVPHANFAFGAGTITVDLAGRSLTNGEQIIAWQAIPPGVTFAWDAETAQAGVGAFAGTLGLYYGCDPDSPVVDAATWTGLGGDGDAMNPLNWNCRNLGGNVVKGGLPTNVESRVCLAVPLTDDLDWTKLGAVNFAAGTIDLNGHALTIARLGDYSGGFNLVDAQRPDAPGALVLVDGTSKLPAGFTSEADVVIRALGGATLDLNGVTGTVFKLEMADGATLGNGGIVLKDESVVGGGIVLDVGATVTFDCASQTHLRAVDNGTYPIALNGGTILKTGAKFAVVNGDITGPGTIRVVKNEFNIGSVGVRFDDDVIVEIMKGNDAYTWAQGNVTMPNLMGDGKSEGSASGYTVTRRYSGLLAVSGVGVTFADGMMLDLSQNTAPYALPDNVTIAKGSKIRIDVGDRVLQPGDKLLSCDAKRIAEVGFVAPNGFHIVRKADGLYVYILPMVFVL